MVLISMMKPVKIILIFVINVLFFSCESEEVTLRDISFVNCNECSTTEPLNATVRLKLEDPYRFGPANPIIQIDIYEGLLEDNVLFRSIQTNSKETSINLTVNKRYTFAAVYLIGSHTYVAVNSVILRVKYTESSCDEPCYYTVPRSVNLKLRNTK
ncbi:MAG TPA: hypothetical protein DDW27_19905 [Bacteroidales bacterium]|nr:hypothetical protein [Bacteroidales bacterium]